MAINTPRLGLRKPGFTDPEQVITDVNNNLDKIDAAVNANVFTSSTRPANPHDGKLIYETDTKLIAIWSKNLGRWDYIGGDGYARGKRAVVTSDVNSSLTTNTEIGPYISITFTVETARRYWIETAFCIGFSGSGSGISGRPRVRWTAGATVTTAGTQLGSDVIDNYVYGAGSTQDFWHQFEVVPNLNGNITVGLFLTGVDAVKQVFFAQATDRSAFLLARDVGSV